MRMQALGRALNIEDLRRAARRRLPKVIFDFVDGGSGAEITLKRNRAGLEAYALVGRPLEDVSHRDLSLSLFGRRHDMPVLVAPTGSSGLLWPRGEAEVARACAAASVTMIVSAGATLSIEEIAAAAGGPKWLQLFIYRDRSITEEFARRAAAAGYEALCLTVDCPLLGHRQRDSRNGFTLRPRLTARTALDAALSAGWWMRMAAQPRVTFRNFEAHGAGTIVSMAEYISGLIDPSVTWKDVAWLRSIWSGPLLLKGILRASDARRALDLGCDGVIVSNHGGRQLDDTLATIDALPEIVEAVEGRAPILIDGGFQRGTDVLKALALGATAVAIGRAHLWGLAVAGRAGVERSLAILREEMDLAMAIGGWPTLAAVDRGSVRYLPSAAPDARAGGGAGAMEM
jgi:L-lactate dehydrogenase (cytochrome)